jgi:hypothetical protein
MTCYLLCFRDNDSFCNIDGEPVLLSEHALLSDHAGHYLGETDKDIDERRDEHQVGRGAKLTAAAAAAGITFVVVRTWPGRYPEERRLKGRPSGSRELKERCPECHPMTRIDRWAGGKPAWARQPETEPAPTQRRAQRHPSAVIQAQAPPAPPQPQVGPYQRGARMAKCFLGTQFDAGRTADQIQAAHANIIRPFLEEPHPTLAQVEMQRGYDETVISRLAELRAPGRSQAKAQAETADMEMEAG